jgi:putative glutamine amidotransferase
VQDLGEEADARHENEAGVDKQHSVSVLPGTLLREVVGMGGGVANSAHHQAIDRLGEGLIVNCRAADGTIEGIEWAQPSGKPFMLAVQWHPERMYVNGVGDEPLWRGVIERFVREVGKGMRFGKNL